jgi:hypothetical protein
MSKSIQSGCKPFSIVDDGTRFVDDGKLHTVHFNIEQEVERIMRQLNKEIDDEVFKRLPKEKLIELKSRIDKELKNREVE